MLGEAGKQIIKNVDKKAQDKENSKSESQIIEPTPEVLNFLQEASPLSINELKALIQALKGKKKDKKRLEKAYKDGLAFSELTSVIEAKPTTIDETKPTIVDEAKPTTVDRKYKEID